MNEVIANLSVVSIQIIRSDGTQEFLGAVTSSKEDDDNHSLDQSGEK